MKYKMLLIYMSYFLTINLYSAEVKQFNQIKVELNVSNFNKLAKRNLMFPAGYKIISHRILPNYKIEVLLQISAGSTIEALANELIQRNIDFIEIRPVEKKSKAFWVYFENIQNARAFKNALPIGFNMAVPQRQHNQIYAKVTTNEEYSEKEFTEKLNNLNLSNLITSTEFA